MRHDTFPKIGDRSAEECLFWMPRIAADAPDEWARGFASSIIRQSRRKGWKPSGKQLGVMRRMVAELFNHGAEVGFDLIE